MKKRNIRKTAAALTALALCAGVLTGCGGAASGTASSVAASSAASSEASGADADALAAQNVADLIDAIYVQQRTDDTDAQCEAAKAAWDTLTDAQKELVEGENADPDYFGRDTGDASKDDARNADEIGENELLVVSFGTSFNDSRAADIKNNRNLISFFYIWSACYDLHTLSSDIYLADNQLICIRMLLDLIDLADHDLIEICIQLCKALYLCAC